LALLVDNLASDKPGNQAEYDPAETGTRLGLFALNWGNLSLRKTAWWRTQSLSNLSQQQNSLLTGKITGNFAGSGLNPQF
jgi:hypothetical protein